MSYQRHHAIIVTSGISHTNIYDIKAKAEMIFGDCISNVVPSEMNGRLSLLIPPDGSSQGREVSNEYDEKREEFKNWLKENAVNSDWVEVEYGDESGEEPKVIEYNTIY